MTIFVKDLKTQEPDELLDSLNELTDANFWLGIAENATFSANKETDRKSKLQWAEVALLTYKFLAEKVDRASRQSYETSAMMFRVKMISQLGANVENSVLNPRLVEEWFFKRLPFSKEKAVNKAADWPKRPIEEIRQLRFIKNRLNVIKQLRKEGYLRDNAELSEWVRISESLP